MKLRTLAVAALAALTLAACSKDGDNGTGGATPDDGIFIQFTGLSSPEARSTSAPVADQTPVTLSDGYLVFGTNGTPDKITHVVAITTNTSSLPTVTVSALESGMVFTGIEASHVYVIGNLQGVTVPAVGGSLSTLLNSTVDVLDQTDATGGLTNATLYGVGQINPAGTESTAAVAAGADKEAIFSVRPLAARLELQKITGKPASGGEEIVSYKLAGIYINNFYLSLGVNGSIVNANPWNGSTGNLVNFLSEYKKYLPHTVATSGYLSTWDEVLYDALNVADVNLVAAPAAGSVWAYNVLAPYGNGNAKSAVPHIILHLTDMILDFDNSPDGSSATETGPSTGEYYYYNPETGTDGECYLTITRYIENYEQVNEADLSIDGGYIYKITDVPFTADDLGDLPEEENQKGFKVYVEVKFVNWTAKSVVGGW